AVAADVDRVGRAAHLPERNALVDAGGHGRDIDDAGAVYGNRVRVLTVPGGVDDHHAGGVEAALPGEGEAAAVHVVNSGGHVQRGLAADRDAVLVNAGLNGADLDAREVVAVFVLHGQVAGVGFGQIGERIGDGRLVVVDGAHPGAAAGARHTNGVEL